MSQRRVKNAPPTPVCPRPVVDDWTYVLHSDTVAGLPPSIRADFEERKPFIDAVPLRANDGSWYVLDPQGGPVAVEVEEVRQWGKDDPVRHIVVGLIPGRTA